MGRSADFPSRESLQGDLVFELAELLRHVSGEATAETVFRLRALVDIAACLSTEDLLNLAADIGEEVGARSDRVVPPDANRWTRAD